MTNLEIDWYICTVKLSFYCLHLRVLDESLFNYSKIILGVNLLLALIVLRWSNIISCNWLGYHSPIVYHRIEFRANLQYKCCAWPSELFHMRKLFLTTKPLIFFSFSTTNKTRAKTKSQYPLSTPPVISYLRFVIFTNHLKPASQQYPNQQCVLLGAWVYS